MRLPRRGNAVPCPKCGAPTLAVHPSTGEVVLADRAAVLDGPAGPLGNWLVSCPRGHRFRVSQARRRSH